MSHLQVKTVVFKNPWIGRISLEELDKIIFGVAKSAAGVIQDRFENREFVRASMGLLILDPTTPKKPQIESWRDLALATIAIGVEGERFLPNAAAKVVEHLVHGVDCGVLVYTQKHRLADGDFRYGFSVIVDGTPVGGSGETELQDRFMSTFVAADFNLRVAEAIGAWEKTQGEGRWYTDADAPPNRYTAIVDQQGRECVRPSL